MNRTQDVLDAGAMRLTLRDCQRGLFSINVQNVMRLFCKNGKRLTNEKGEGIIWV